MAVRFEIPKGWYYAGSGNSFLTQFDADNEISILNQVYPKRQFKTILDPSGGPAYERWLIITNKNPRDEPIFRKSKKTSKKTKRKRR